MTVKLLLNLGTRHPVVGNVDRDKHVAGSTHDFPAGVEEELIKMGHAELVSKPKTERPSRRKPKTETSTEES